MYFKAQVPTTPPTPAHRVMTVIIDQDNPNPTTWATYADDAVGMTAGSSDWDDFIGHYPCLLLNGVENGKLNPNNFGQFTDGTTADITSGDAGEVMIAFPRHGLKMFSDGRYLTISVTDEDNAAGFDYSAFSYKGQECSHVYQGAYEGYSYLGKLHSLSGKSPSASMNISTFRTHAQANGTGYEQRTYFPLVYLQCLYMLKYKGQNAQIAIGKGYTNSYNSSPHATGTTNTKGMDWGETTGTQACKLFGIEDFWGNEWDFVDGIISTSNRICFVADGNFNDTGSGYTSTGSPYQSSNINGYFTRVNDNVTPQMGFLPNPAYKNLGTDFDYFCDYAMIASSRWAIFGGDWINESNAGVFELNIARTNAYADTDVGARLSYFKLKT